MGDSGSSSPTEGAGAPGSADRTQLQSQKVLVCVTGGIAAYKVVEVVRLMVQSGADVHVIMTEAAQQFVGRQTFAGVSNNPVHSEIFEASGGAPHVELARGADAAIVAPATANALAKLATGLADDLVGATLLMTRCTLILAPAMHTEMWEHPATQERIGTLRARGAVIVGPATGQLMSGDEGPGRMVEPEEIVDSLAEVLGITQSLAGRRVLVTAGGTQEPIDAVRFVGNRSSGLMGMEIARAAHARGAKVTLVLGPTGRATPPGVDVVEVRTADDMRETVAALAGNADVIIKAAAVADFKPRDRADHKLKKAGGPPEVVLEPTVDILAELGASPSLRKPGGVLVGFAAETEADPKKLAQLAVAKRDAKKADLLVANDVGSSDSGFGTRTNRAVIAGPEGVTDVGLVTKRALAEALIAEVSRLLERRGIG
jgi:phosphopantothenoylcysteine decarboxylase/phosphopantothenate--cysteine ligase